MISKVPMKPGDAALVDVRVLHATRDNNTDERRSMITCWWVPTGAEVQTPEVWEAEFAHQTVANPHDLSNSTWSDAQTASVEALYCKYAGQLGRYHGGPSRQVRTVRVPNHADFWIQYTPEYI